MKMTNKEFCKRLREAKKIAVANYKENKSSCSICDACNKVDLNWIKNATFGEGTTWAWSSWSWTEECAKSPDDIARVFDESIKALGEKP